MQASYQFLTREWMHAFCLVEEMEPKSRIKNDFSKLRAQRMHSEVVVSQHP